jgi:D-serine deaminase-like pyridoxal phosphate-dependent protein
VSEIGLNKNELDTPLLWVDLERLERNIAGLSDHFKAAGVQWRPHIKGIKTPAIAHKLVAAGAIGVTCAKLAEAEVMAQAGLTDLLIANQVVGAKKIRRLVNLCGQAEVKVAVDDPANVIELGALAVEKGVEVGVVIEVDTGMQRCGVAPGEAVVALGRLIQQTAGLRFRGLMAWEGHTVAISEPERKQHEVELAMAALADSAAGCRAAGLPVDIVSGGGSGTYKISPFLAALTEVQAGGVIFNDVTYQNWGAETEQSLFVRSMVTSRPSPERIIFDAGFKALPAWANRTPCPVGLPGVESVKMSAEHGIVTLTGPNHSIKPGDTFDFVPGYTDMTLFLYDQIYAIRHEVVEAIWPIQARGKLA